MTQVLKIIQQETLLRMCTMLLVLFIVSNAMINYKLLAVRSCSKGYRSRTAMIHMVTFYNTNCYP